MYALVDCNNFFASCERVFQPALEKRPVVVLSNNDGCIIARSNEAKALGIPMGMPYFKAKDTIQRHDVAVFSSNYELYGDMSDRVMGSLAHFCPDMEVYSIDEAFLHLDSFAHLNLKTYCADIRNKVMQWTGIPICIGIAPTKTLAKIANHVAKKHTKSGVFDMSDPIMRERVLAHIPVEELWGVGRKWSVKLRQFGIGTAADFAKADQRMIRKHFSVVGERMLRELQGIPCLSLKEVEPKRNITSSRSFGIRVRKLAHLEQAISMHVENGCRKLRRQQSAASAVYAFIRTNKHRADAPQYRAGAMHGFTFPTADSRQIITAAKACLHGIYREGYDYNKAGIMLMDVVPASQCQHHLFADTPDTSMSERLMTTLDDVNQRLGGKSLFFAAQGVDQPWGVQRNLRSSRSTTHWTELPTVMC